MGVARDTGASELPPAPGPESGEQDVNVGAALLTARTLRASMPPAVKKYHGNLEGYEWWEQHEGLFEEARLQWGMRDPHVYSLTPGPAAETWQPSPAKEENCEADAEAGAREAVAGNCGADPMVCDDIIDEEVATTQPVAVAAAGAAAGAPAAAGSWGSWLRPLSMRWKSPVSEALWLKPEVREALARGTPQALLSVLEEVCCDSAGHKVFAFDLFEEAFCDRLLAELDHIECSGIPLRRPNGMNRYGAILSNLGFQETLLEPLMKHVVMPFSHFLWPEWVDKKDCDETYGFVVRYRIGEDVDLAEHADTSNVTLNACLGREFEGGDLYFKGVRFTDSCDTKEPLEPAVAHKKGRAVLHLGGHFHGVLPITSGERSNLVLWATGQGGVVRIRPSTPR